MKKLLTALTLSCFALTANAEYTLKIPLEQAQGGFLPNGSIKLKAQSNSSGTFECLGIVGGRPGYLTCDNGVIVGTSVGREVTGTCQGNTYNIITPRPHSGTCGVD